MSSEPFESCRRISLSSSPWHLVPNQMNGKKFLLINREWVASRRHERFMQSKLFSVGDSPLGLTRPWPSPSGFSHTRARSDVGVRSTKKRRTQEKTEITTGNSTANHKACAASAPSGFAALIVTLDPLSRAQIKTSFTSSRPCIRARALKTYKRSSYHPRWLLHKTSG
jgi:hypothetical protein